MKKYYECFFNGKGEIEQVMSYGGYLWAILVFWFIPVYCIWRLFWKSCSRKDFFYIDAKDFHKKKIKELSNN